MLKKLRPLFPYMRRYYRGYIAGALCVICSNALWILFPQIIRNAINDLTHHLTRHGILIDALLLVALAASKGIFLYLTRWILIGISRDIEYDLRNDLLLSLERQSLSYYQEHRTGDIMARTTNDLNAVRMLLGPAIMYSANTVLFTIGALFFMLRISPWLTLLAFAPLPAASILVQYFGRRIHERFERIQAMFSDISAQVQENISGVRLIRAFAQEQAEIRAFARANKEYIRRSLLLVRLMGMLWPTLEFLLGLSLVVVLWVGGHQVLSHRISVGAFVAFNTYMLMLTWPVIALGWVINIVQRGTASMTRIHEILVAEPTIFDTHEAGNSTEVRGEIEFRNMSFAYAEDQPAVLKNINLKIPAGSSLAIVGPTGSGKTTLVRLIPRLFDVERGMLLLDGRPAQEYKLETLRQAIGFVPQETFLFSETIQENIAFGRPDATEEQVLEAARIASIGDEILEFPRGFATMVGERGITLSGGQKQRTAIARALVREPAILISHRISTVRSADQIAVLVDGQIAELGSHDELVARNGHYARLFEKQMLEEELSVAG